MGIATKHLATTIAWAPSKTKTTNNIWLAAWDYNIINKLANAWNINP